MEALVSKGRARILLAIVLCFALCSPQLAYAYYNEQAVSIDLGSSDISVVAGSSVTVSLSVDPLSEEQLPGCGMAVCPQACDGLVTPDGVMGGCLNEAGWCTCAGNTYYTAYTQLSVRSSDPSVARASVSGSALSIQGIAAGTASITVHASLSKHIDNAVSMTVDVSEPTPSTPDKPDTPYTDPKTPTTNASGAVSVTATGVPRAALEAAASASDTANEVLEITAEDGSLIVVMPATDAQTAGLELKRIAGTEGQLTFWSGGTVDAPSISLTFKGSELDPNADLAFDPSVQASRKGTGELAKLLADASDALVMDFAHEGAFPAKATIYVRVSGLYEDGQHLSLFLYNTEKKQFELAQEGIVVDNGYADYEADHCSIWALSAEDLTAYTMPADVAAVDATGVDVHAQSGMPFVITTIVIVILAALVLGFVLLRRRRLSISADETATASNLETDSAKGDSEK